MRDRVFSYLCAMELINSASMSKTYRDIHFGDLFTDTSVAINVNGNDKT